MSTQPDLSRIARRSKEKEELRMLRATELNSRFDIKNAGLAEASTMSTQTQLASQDSAAVFLPPNQVAPVVTKEPIDVPALVLGKRARRKFLHVSPRPLGGATVGIGVMINHEVETSIAAYCLNNSSSSLTVSASMIMDAALGSLPPSPEQILEVVRTTQNSSSLGASRRIHLIVSASRYEPLLQWNNRLRVAGIYNAGVSVGQVYQAALVSWLVANSVMFEPER